jgi:adenylate kinase
MKNHREVIVLLGKPGSGKGTQAEPLARALGIPTVSPGKLWRAEIKNRTAIGRKGERYVNAGKLAPNNLTAELLRRRLKLPDVKRGVILDGFPRDYEQALALEEIAHVTHALLVSITDREVMRRLSGRRVCMTCGRNYHVTGLKPKKTGVCDVDGGRLVRRPDDNPRIVRERIHSYRYQTIPVLQFYRWHRVLRRVDGVGTVPEVQKRILSLMGAADRKKKL